MNTKTVSQLDAQGYFTGLTQADESPLEPGIFPLPAGCVDALPPEIPEGKCARYLNGTFTLEALPTAAVSPTDSVATHAELVASVLLSLKSRRLDIFRVLDTLQVDALTSGNQVEAQTIMQAKAQMAALNNIDFSAYTTKAEMEQAVQVAYYMIVASAPPALQVKFNALIPG